MQFLSICTGKWNLQTDIQAFKVKGPAMLSVQGNISNARRSNPPPIADKRINKKWNKIMIYSKNEFCDVSAF